MKEYVVTRTVVETFFVSAPDRESALRDAKDPSSITVVKETCRPYLPEPKARKK